LSDLRGGEDSNFVSTGDGVVTADEGGSIQGKQISGLLGSQKSLLMDSGVIGVYALVWHLAIEDGGCEQFKGTTDEDDFLLVTLALRLQWPGRRSQRS